MALRIALVYAGVGSLWILGSGWLLRQLVPNGELRETLETLKGWFFVVFTAGLLGLTLHRHFLALRRSADLLKVSEERYRLVTEQGGIGVWDWDLRNDRWYISPVFYTMLGYDPKAGPADRQEWLERVHPDDRPLVEEAIRKALERRTETYSYQARMRHADGSYRWIDVKGFNTERDADGKVTRLLGIRTDVTKRKNLEEGLRQAQKLEAIGQLAGGVAHDFNNILAATTMQLDLLLLEPGLDEPTRQALAELQTANKRAASLTRQLLMFGRRSVMNVQPVDLREVIANLLKMLTRLIGENIDLRFDGLADLPRIEADVAMIEQVIMNLVVNARDAMPKGGRITLSTRAVQEMAKEDGGPPESAPAHFVCLAVTDTGVGMDDQTLVHLFEPFFTTKEPGKGTGLGLATVHGIVAQHRGRVEVQSQLGQGSTFRVYLPVATEAVTPAVQESRPAPPRRGRETILVVEDDEMVRRLSVRSLRTLGYTVHEASNGQAAMALWQTHGPQIDLLLTDMVMPESLSGLDLVEQLQAQNPNLKAVISSGYSSEILQSGNPPRPGIQYLPKPYEMRALARLVRNHLDGTP